MRDADDWTKQRRAEILSSTRPKSTAAFPRTRRKSTWEVTETDAERREGAAVMKRLVGRMGNGGRRAAINLTLYTPAEGDGPVPVILL